MCVMYTKFIHQAERILSIHGNHESTGYFKKVVQDAHNKFKHHREKATQKQKMQEVHPLVQRLVAGARDFKEVGNAQQ